MRQSTIPIVLILFVFAQGHAQGQKPVPTTDSFLVTGVVDRDLIIAIADIPTAKAVSIPDLVITNHVGQAKGTAKGLKGILVKDVLKDIPFKVEDPKVLSQFYLTFVASDGYAAVFSWNEIFNSPAGDNLYLITEKEGEQLAVMHERILIMSIKDFKTGRRNIKGLSRIVVGRARD